MEVDLNIAGVAQPTGGSGAETLIDIEDVIGSPFGDRLTGSADSNLLDGGAGADEIDGREGADTLRGGDGQDAIDSVDGSADSVSCGEGPDSLTTDALDSIAPDCTPDPDPTPTPTPGADLRLRLPTPGDRAGTTASGAGGGLAPTLALSVPRQSLRSVRKRGLRVTLRCSLTCRASGRVIADRRTARSTRHDRGDAHARPPRACRAHVRQRAHGARVVHARRSPRAPPHARRPAGSAGARGRRRRARRCDRTHGRAAAPRRLIDIPTRQPIHQPKEPTTPMFIASRLLLVLGLIGAAAGLFFGAKGALLELMITAVSEVNRKGGDAESLLRADRLEGSPRQGPREDRRRRASCSSSPCIPAISWPRRATGSEDEGQAFKVQSKRQRHEDPAYAHRAWTAGGQHVRVRRDRRQGRRARRHRGRRQGARDARRRLACDRDDRPRLRQAPRLNVYLKNSKYWRAALDGSGLSNPDQDARNAVDKAAATIGAAGSSARLAASPPTATSPPASRPPAPTCRRSRPAPADARGGGQRPMARPPAQPQAAGLAAPGGRQRRVERGSRWHTTAA